MQDDRDRPGVELLDAAVELLSRRGRGGTVRVQGDSMLPTLRQGQMLAVEFSPQRLARGDLILFHQGGCLLVHRLLGRARSRDGHPRLRTRGDGVWSLDPAVDLDRVVGRVVALEDDGSWRSTQRAGARGYGVCLAWHALFWASLGVLARVGDRALGRLRIPPVLRPVVEAADAWLLRQIHRFLFRPLHATVPTPGEAGGQPG